MKLSLLIKWRIAQLISADDRLTPTARRVGLRLLDHYNLKTGRCDPSNEALANALGCTSRAVQEAVKMLEARAWIVVCRRGGSGGCNSYRLRFDRHREYMDLRLRGRADPSANSGEGDRNAKVQQPEHLHPNDGNARSPKDCKKTKKTTSKGIDNAPTDISKTIGPGRLEYLLEKWQNQLTAQFEFEGEGWRLLLEMPLDELASILQRLESGDLSLTEAKECCIDILRRKRILE